MKVEMVSLSPKKSFHNNNDTYIVTGSGWRAYLQKKLLALTRKLGASDLLPYTEYERITVDTTDIVEACREQIMRIYKHTGKIPTQIIVGKKEYYQLGTSMTTNFLLHSDESIRFIENDKVRKLSLYGVTVTVNPWMEGIIVVP